jgi:hypothetical protein
METVNSQEKQASFRNGGAVPDGIKIADMSNSEYRAEIDKMLDAVQDNQVLRYFYIYVSEKLRHSGMEQL